MKKMFLFAACLAVLACSCSENEEGTVKDVRASLKINANIGAPAVSRAEKTAWEAGDKLGLYVCNGTLGTPYNQNAVYTNTLLKITQNAPQKLTSGFTSIKGKRIGTAIAAPILPNNV